MGRNLDPSEAPWDQRTPASGSFARASRPALAERFAPRALVCRSFAGSGLVDVGVEAGADAYPVGHSWRTVLMDLVEALTPKILDRGLADQRELDDLRRAATEHVADPATVVVSFLLFLVWGRKPP
jgi:hypothetical protein